MRILHVPTDTGNLGPLMAREMRKLGHDAWSIAFAKNYLDFQPDEFFGGRSQKELLMVEFKRWKVILRSLRYDAVIFNFGSSMLPNPIFIGWGLSSKYKPRFRMIYSFLSLPFSWFMWDVALLWLLGKKIGVVFQGGDARQGGILKAQGRLDITEEPPGYYTKWMDRIKQRRAKLWDRYATVIWWHNPDLWHGLPKRSKLLPYPIEVKDMLFTDESWNPSLDYYTENSCGPPIHRSGVSMAVRGPTFESPNSTGATRETRERPVLATGRLTFGHFVNHREPKGTDYVLAAMHKARMDGGDFKFLFGERFEHEEALDLYKKVDVLLEQFTIGWYGLQACEVALMGKPVVVFLDERDKPQLPPGMWEDCPFIKATIGTLPWVLNDILTMDREKLAEIGRNGREFVKKWHDSRSVAKQMAKQMLDELENPKKSWW